MGGKGQLVTQWERTAGESVGKDSWGLGGKGQLVTRWERTAGESVGKDSW